MAVKDTQPSTYCSLGVIFMGLGIAKVDQESIPEQLGDMSIIALDDLGTDPLIRTHHVPVLFGVELGGECGGVHQVTEHHRELAPFGFGRGRDDWCGLALRRREVRRGRRRHWRGGCRCYGRPTCPDKDSPVFIHSEMFGVDEFIFEFLQILVIECEPAFERPDTRAVARAAADARTWARRAS